MRLNPFITLLLLAGSLQAQAVPEKSTPTAGPRLVRFSGAVPALPGPPAAIGAIFSIYTDEFGGSALWSEQQNVGATADGKYTVLLGATTAAGIPAGILSTGESRWLQVEVPGQAPMPRVLLVSVPYALKAADADTLGGIPASAFLLANAASTATTVASPERAPTLPVVRADGSPAYATNYVAKFNDATGTLTSSSIFDNGTAIGIGGASILGAATLIGNVPGGDAPGMALFNIGSGAGASVSVDFYNTVVNGGIPQAKLKAIDDGNYSDHLTFLTKTPGGPSNAAVERMRLTSAGSLGIGTTTPAQTLDVNGKGRFVGGIVFGDGTSMTTAATGGSGSGTITGVTAGTGLTGGGTSGTVTLNLDMTKIQIGSAGTFNTAVGTASLPSTSTGIDNTAFGYQALSRVSNGSSNTAIGTSVLALLTTASNNTGLGSGAMSGATVTGGNNTGLGTSAMVNLSSGTDNTTVGFKAGYIVSTGTQNTAVGSGALQGVTAATLNTAIGYLALSGSITASTSTGNVAVGNASLPSFTSGQYNTALGSSAGQNLTSGSNNLYLASSGPSSSGSESNTTRIGFPTNQTRTFVSGITGVTTGLSGALTVVVDSNGQLGTVSSSRRYKEDIEDMGEASDRLMRLRPVTYRYKQPYADGSKPIDYGLIAEEVSDIYPDLVAHNASGEIQSVQYQKLTPMLLNEVQKLNAKLAAERADSDSLKDRVKQLEELVQQLLASGRRPK